MLANLFYFKKLSKIGGTEQFLYEIAKKYNKYDIAIYYDVADPKQLQRLRKYVKCQKRTPGEKIKCKRAFFNFNIEMIEDVEAEQYYFISHANYEELGYKPPITNEKLTNFIGVSNFATRKLQEYIDKLGKESIVERCYNPLQIEPKEKVIKLVAAGRFDDKVKGRDRINQLIEELDKYCNKTGRNYIFLIFTNAVGKDAIVNSKNVAIMQPRIDVRPYIAEADYTIQLSNDMETFGYTINESLAYGVPIITTPLSILEELPIPEGANLIYNWDGSNKKEIVREIFEGTRKPFHYTPPEDEWERLLIKSKSKYVPEETKKIIVTKKIYDSQEEIYIEPGTEIEREIDRADELINLGVCKEVEAQTKRQK